VCRKFGLKLDLKLSSLSSEKSTSFLREDVILENLPAAKKTEIRYLSDVQSQGLTSTVSAFVRLKKAEKKDNKAFDLLEGSLTPLAAYEAAKLLKTHQSLNAFYYDGHIAIYKNVHIGIALDLDNGLKVVTIPNTDQKSLFEISNEIYNLTCKYVARTLSPTDLASSTFTITDLSSEDVHYFRPLVNRQQSAILGIAASDKQLNRSIISLTFDHRVTTGKQAAQFLKSLVHAVEKHLEK